MKSNLDLCLDSFTASVLQVTKGSYGGKWPMPFFTSIEVGSVIGEYWADFLLKIVQRLRATGLSSSDIARRVKHPSRPSRALYPNLELKYLRYPREKLEIKDRFLSDVMSCLYRADPYCAHGSNVLLDDEELQTAFRPDCLIRVTELDAPRAATQYNGYLRAIAEMLYFYWDNIAHEFHGPYSLPSGDLLLVREWHDLRPGYFDFSTTFPYDSLAIYEVYRAGTGITIDISNRLYIDSRTDQSLLAFYFQSLNRPLSRAETFSLIDEIAECCRRGVTELASLPREILLKHAVHMHFYLLKPFSDILNTDWKPGSVCMERVARGIRPRDREASAKLMRLELDASVVRQLFDFLTCKIRDFVFQGANDKNVFSFTEN